MDFSKYHFLRHRDASDSQYASSRYCMDTKEGNVVCISVMLHIMAQASCRRSPFRRAWSKSGWEINKGNQKLHREERKNKIRDVRMRSLNLIQEEANGEKAIDATSW